MALFDDRFITGVIVTGSGHDFPHWDAETDAELAERIREDDPDLMMPDLGDRFASGAVIEDLAGIFENAILVGGPGNNTMVVGTSTTPSLSAAKACRCSVDRFGEPGQRGQRPGPVSEYYIVNLSGTSAARVSIDDSGVGAGADYLVVLGTNGADSIVLGATGSGGARAGTISIGLSGSAASEVLTYRQVERVMLSARGGDDAILSDDTAAVTVIDMGSGDDEIVIGTVPFILDAGNPTLEYPDGVPVATPTT